MINKNEKLLFELYNIAELKYIKNFQDKGIDINDLFPDDWYRSKDYKTKIKILNDAIVLDKLVIDTPSYVEIIEKIDNSEKKLTIDNNDIYNNNF